MSAAEVPVWERLYLTVKEAAALAGIGEKRMYELVNGRNPPPMLVMGHKRLIQRKALEAYLEDRNTWKY